MDEDEGKWDSWTTLPLDKIEEVADVSAGYDPASGKVALTLEDGRTLSLTAGQHIEEAQEW